jgi:hypothetical protein
MLIKIVENSFYTKIQNAKLLKTPFDAVFFALSDETTFKLFYHTDSTNLPYLWEPSGITFSKNGI